MIFFLKLKKNLRFCHGINLIINLILENLKYQNQNEKTTHPLRAFTVLPEDTRSGDIYNDVIGMKILITVDSHPLSLPVNSLFIQKILCM